jgi:hypothetical protein
VKQIGTTRRLLIYGKACYSPNEGANEEKETFAYIFKRTATVFSATHGAAGGAIRTLILTTGTNDVVSWIRWGEGDGLLNRKQKIMALQCYLPWNNLANGLGTLLHLPDLVSQTEPFGQQWMWSSQHIASIMGQHP